MYWYRCNSALALRFQGGLLRRVGRPEEVLPALREARAIIDAMPRLTNFDRINLAACLAQLQVIARSARPMSESGTVPDQEGARQLGDPVRPSPWSGPVRALSFICHNPL